MRKAEVKIYVAQLVECGKGLAFASLMEQGEPRELTENILNNQIDDISKQLELYCEDANFKELKEYLEDEENNRAIDR